MSSAEERIHYDSIWRRIKSDDYATKLEGQFRDARDRLAALNNWGSLSWLYPHATATKLAHHRGVEHNAQHFLDADVDREKHRPSFRIASHALHWGHLPLSYAGAEGVLRAVSRRHLKQEGARRNL
jgi:HD superfamily phosphohydrolase